MKEKDVRKVKQSSGIENEMNRNNTPVYPPRIPDLVHSSRFIPGRYFGLVVFHSLVCVRWDSSGFSGSSFLQGMSLGSACATTKLVISSISFTFLLLDIQYNDGVFLQSRSSFNLESLFQLKVGCWLKESVRSHAGGI